MQTRSVNLIVRSNGAGLTRDMQLLAGILRGAGYDITLTQLGHRGRLSNRLRRLHARVRRLWRGWMRGVLNARYDINIMIEHVRPELFRHAHHNVLIPNPEWFHSEWLPHLPRFDRVFAKTRHAERIFGELNCKTTYIGFTSEDCRLAGVVRQPGFFHGPGRSGNKGTLPLIELWSKHPEWPTLTVVWRRKRVNIPELPPNVRLIRHYMEEQELRRLQNAHAFHLCPSQTEGYGHSLVESLSLGAVTVTVDGEPMNELITPDRGVLVAAHATGRQELATLYDFDMDSMRQAVERCISMPNEEQALLGRAARHWYEGNQKTFPKLLLDAIAALGTHLPHRH
ncbi:glycosyltransferase [Dyella subtropica]|uniref:glycosyltransferase n=1 Tax=Dyella subtropica TaxID=2992127 RepID=UPI002251A08A|nr:glycosyltransferase [Dyella subtropica]